MAKKIRPTKSWQNYKKYFTYLLDGVETRHCTGMTTKCHGAGKLQCKEFCKKIKDILAKLENTALEICKMKPDPCKSYCTQYCDHFKDMDSPLHQPKCPMHQQNQTEVLLPANEDIENYLKKYMEGKDCRE